MCTYVEIESHRLRQLLHNANGYLLVDPLCELSIAAHSVCFNSMPNGVTYDLELGLRVVQAAQLVREVREHCLQLREVGRFGAIGAAGIGGCCLCVCHSVRFLVVVLSM